MTESSNCPIVKAMALSDRERRLLAEMEAALASDDPRLQSTLSGDTTTLIRNFGGGALSGALLILSGVATLFGGLIAQITLVGIAGFILALAGVLTALRSLSGKSVRLKAKAPRSLASRLNDRWDRRTFE